VAGIFRSKKNSSASPSYTSLQLQTSALGLCIPLGWGRFRVAGNLIDYMNFQQHPPKKKKGKGGSGGKNASASTTTTYSATIVIAICEGGCPALRKVWYNQSTVSAPSLGFVYADGSNPQTPWSYFTSFYPDHALTYAGTAFVAASAFDLGSGATLPNMTFEMDGPLSNLMPTSGGDANPADITYDFLTNPQYSLSFPSSLIDTASLDHYRTYCNAQGLWLSPLLTDQEQVTSILQRWAQLTNTWIFWSGSAIKFVPLGDCNIVANGATYLPNCQPIYDLTYDDFIVSGADAVPVTLSRSDPADGYNRVRLHINDRSHDYNDTPVDWIDQGSFDQYGLLQAQEVQATEICDPAIGAIVAQLIGLRATYQRNTYKFTLAYGFVLLEPGDVVTLTEPNIGLDRVFVRVTSVEENDQGLLDIEAEEFAFDCATGTGVFSQSTAYTQGGNYTQLPNIGFADPGDVNPPMIMEPDPTLLAGNAPQVWIGLSGGENWGGADVYLSFDNTTFSEIGTIYTPSPQGVLTANLPSHADPDTVDTLSVDLAESRTVLPSTATTADADAGRTLCLVGDELLAYGTLTPGSSAYAADLTYLRRGQFSTSPGSHSIGTNFTRIDLSAILSYTLPAQYVGQTLYLKFPSFNLFGAMHQDLSAVPTYVYTPTGIGFTTSATLQMLVNGDIPVGIITDQFGQPVYVEQ
jgi:hypothetical protein